MPPPIDFHDSVLSLSALINVEPGKFGFIIPSFSQLSVRQMRLLCLKSLSYWTFAVSSLILLLNDRTLERVITGRGCLQLRFLSLCFTPPLEPLFFGLDFPCVQILFNSG